MRSMDFLDAACFVAIDFETADRGRDSACAIGLVRVEGGVVSRRLTHLIRPPRSYFEFTWVHGITWEDVAQKPSFANLWPELVEMMNGAECLVAHNASFDRSVLTACCLSAGVPPPEIHFACTMKLARKLWNVRPTKLPDVCQHLGFSMEHHHDALADADACARIMIAASRNHSAKYEGL